MEQITNMYNKQHEKLQQDQFIFNRSLEGWKASATISMKQWIKSNRPFIEYCLSKALKKINYIAQTYERTCKIAMKQ
eukprot:12809059-Ditylum_brightwellii.AAC.1